MWLRLLPFEWSYHLRQPSTWALLGTFVLLGFGFGAQGGLGDAAVHRDGPWAVAYALGVLALGAPFLVMILAVHAVLRDQTYRMTPILHATRLTPVDFLLSRFLGLWTVAVAVFSMAAVGYRVGTGMPWIDPAALGGGSAANYLRPWLFLVLPDLFVVAVVLFLVAAVSRSRLATFVGGVLFYALYMASAVVFDSPLMAGSAPATVESLRLAALADPFGLAAFLEQSHLWTVEERNTRVLALGGSLAANRLVWLVLSGLVLVGLGRSLSLRHSGRFVFTKPLQGGARRRTVSPPSAGLPDGASSSSAVTGGPALPYRPTVPRAPGVARALGTFAARVRLEVAAVVRSRAFWVLLLLWIFMLTMELVPRIFGGGEYGAHVYPTTGYLLAAIETPLLLVGALALVFYGGEVAGSDRDAGFAPLLDATPARPGALLAAKVVGLWSVPMILMLVATGVCLAIQLVAVVDRVEPLLYLGLFYFQGSRLLLLAVLALVVQAVAGNKTLGMALTFVVFLVASELGSRAGLDHPLLRFGAAPEVVYTDMNGYGPAVESFNAFLLHWNVLAVGLLALALVVWPRGHERGLLGRFRRLATPEYRRARWAFVASLGVALGTGGFLVYQTCVAAPYCTRAAELDRRAAYETRYKRLEDLPEPTPVALEVELDLYPHEERYRMTTRLEVENETEAPIEEIWFTAVEGPEVTDFEVEGAVLEEQDERLGAYRFRFIEPLAPGSRTRAVYTLRDENRGYPTRRGFSDYGMVANGSYLMEQFLAPRIGYRASLEITSDFERRRRNLAPRKTSPTDGSHLPAERGDDGYDWVSFEALVSTAADQIPLAPGNRVADWEEGGRRWVRFRSRGPIPRAIAFFSARYAVESLRHDGIDVEVYYHPSHGMNVDRMLDVARRTVELSSSRFLPYGFDHLRLAEIPATWPFGGFAAPGTIALTADRNFLVDVRDPAAFDLVAKRTAHEVAHQWWGHGVHPVTAPGSALLVEGLAKHVEWMVLDDLYGPGQTRALLDYEHRRYQRSRALDPEPEEPLARVESQGYLLYSKGYLAMNALRAAMGAEALDGTLGQFARANAYPRPAPEVDDLLDAFVEALPEERVGVVDDWFREVTEWDLAVESASCSARREGGFETRLEIAARKFRYDAAGRRVEVPIDDWIEVGLFTEGPVSDPASALHLEVLRVDRELTGLTIVSDRRPDRVEVDPSFTYVEADRLDNRLDC